MPKEILSPSNNTLLCNACSRSPHGIAGRAEAPPAGWMKGLGHLDDDVIRAGVVVKRAVSATVWKNWRPRYVVLRMGCIEWHKVTGLEDEGAETEDLPAGLMRLRPTTECSAGGERAHCLTLCTSGRVLQLNPDTLTRTP